CRLFVASEPGDGGQHCQQDGEGVGETVPKLEVPGKRPFVSDLVGAIGGKSLLCHAGRKPLWPRLERLEELLDRGRSGVPKSRGAQRAHGGAVFRGLAASSKASA